MKTLVFEYRIVPFSYFIDEMGVNQAIMCMEYIKWTDITLKSLIRYNIWNMYQSNAFYKNPNKIENIMELPWDKENEIHTISTESDKKEQREKMKELEEMMKRGNLVQEKFM